MREASGETGATFNQKSHLMGHSPWEVLFFEKGEGVNEHARCPKQETGSCY